MRASISSGTRVAAVVKPTERPFRQAASLSPGATWVLPVPLGPRAMTFSRRRVHSQRASSSASVRLLSRMDRLCRPTVQAGIARKPKLSRLLVAGNFTALIRRSIMRRSRSISSSFTSRARNRTWSSSSVSGTTRLAIDANRHEDFSRGGGTYEAIEGLEDRADNGRHGRPFQLDGPRDQSACLCMNLGLGRPGV